VVLSGFVIRSVIIRGEQREYLDIDEEETGEWRKLHDEWLRDFWNLLIIKGTEMGGRWE